MAQEAVKKHVLSDSFIAERVYNFLLNYPFEVKNPDEKKYIARIKDGVKNDTFIIAIDYEDIYSFYQSLKTESEDSDEQKEIEEYHEAFSEIVKKLDKNPLQVTSIFKDAITEVLRDKFRLPGVDEEEQLIPESNYSVYISGYAPDVELSDIDSTSIGKIIKAKGMLLGYEDDVLIKTLSTTWICGQEECGQVSVMKGINPPKECPGCGNSHFTEDVNAQVNIDCLNIILQQPFESRTVNNYASMVRKVIRIEGKALVNHFKATIPPGSTVEITGTVTLSPKKVPIGQNSKQYNMARTEIYAMYLESKKDDSFDYNDEIQNEVISKVKPSMVSNHVKKLLASVAPHIYGNTVIKLSLLLQLVGAPSVMVGGSRIRGDIHMLLMGDPSCYSGNTLVTLADGRQRRIKDLGINHLDSMNLDVIVNNKGEIGKAKIFHKYEFQPVIEVITETGKSLTVTHNNPLMTDKGWMRADQLNVGDYLQTYHYNSAPIEDKIVRTGFKIEKTFGPKYKGKIPEYYDDNLLSFLGYSLGDGYIRDTEIHYSIQHNELGDLRGKLNNICENVFGLQPIEHEIDSSHKSIIINNQTNIQNKSYEFIIHSTPIAKMLSFMRNISRDRNIPSFLFEMSNRQVAIFLRWLYSADGTVFANGRGKNAIALKSASINLLRDVQQLLLRFGITARILSEDNSHTLTIRRFDDIIKFGQIGFEVKRKQDKLIELIEIAKTKKSQLKSDYEYIKEIKYKTERETVYDIEVPKYHSFIANGIVSHNTGKSEFGRTFLKLVPKSVYVQADAATGVGLTSAVMPPDEMGSRRIELGALPLANGSGVFVEEIDKLKNREDLNNLSSALDDVQVIVPRKGGFMSELPTRAPCIFAANPHGGADWDQTKSIYDQTKFPTWFFSRMDLIWITRKPKDKVLHEKILQHRTHYIMNAESEDDYNKNRKIVNPFSPSKLNELRKMIETDDYLGVYTYEYMINEIKYLKTHYNPTLPQDSEAFKMIDDFIISAQPMVVQQKDGTVVSYTVVDNRTKSSIIRFALASARLHRREVVSMADVKLAITLIRESIDTRKIEAPTLAMGEGGGGSSDGMFSNPKVLNNLLKLTDHMAQMENDRYITIMKSLSNRAKQFNKAMLEIGTELCTACKGIGYNMEMNSRRQVKCSKCDGAGKFRKDFYMSYIEDFLINKKQNTAFTTYPQSRGQEEIKIFINHYVKMGWLRQKAVDTYEIHGDIVNDIMITRGINNFVRQLSGMIYDKEMADKFDETKKKTGGAGVGMTDITTADKLR